MSFSIQFQEGASHTSTMEKQLILAEIVFHLHSQNAFGKLHTDSQYPDHTGNVEVVPK